MFRRARTIISSGGMATIRDKPGHIAASDSSRMSYKPLFCAADYRGKTWTTVHSIQVIENEGHIEMRVASGAGRGGLASF